MTRNRMNPLTLTLTVAALWCAAGAAQAAVVYVGPGTAFFDENNWEDEDTGNPPPANSINPGTPIAFDMVATGATFPTVTAEIYIDQFQTLTLDGSTLVLTDTNGTRGAGTGNGGAIAMLNGSFLDTQNVTYGLEATVDGTSTLNLRGSADPLFGAASRIFMDPMATLVLPNGISGTFTDELMKIIRSDTGASVFSNPEQFKITGDFSGLTTIVALPTPGALPAGLGLLMLATLRRKRR